uniref:CBM-cenC domain-containing protein n=1 Tax=viral metagenome TaxID=1070528 RepID=A0A6M3J8S3_9ZZZZ
MPARIGGRRVTFANKIRPLLSASFDVPATNLAGPNNGTLTSPLTIDRGGALVVTDTYATTEMAGNVGFETAGAGDPDFFGTWTESAGNGAIADEGTLVDAGTHAAKLTAGATANTFVNQNITVIPGLSYQFTFKTRGDGTYGGRYGIYDVTHSQWITALTATAVSGTSYTTVTASVVAAPAACVSMGIYLYCPTTNTGIAYFDTVSLKPTQGLLAISNIYQALGASNLLYNGDFEVAARVGWTDTAGDGAIADTTTAGEFNGGARAVKITAGATANTKDAQAHAVIPGQTYTLAMWCRGDATNAGRYGVYDATNSADITARVTTGITSATYTAVSTTFLAPAGCVSARIDLWCPSVNGGIAYFDDVVVTQVPAAERRLVCYGGKVTGVWGDPGVWGPLIPYSAGLCVKANIIGTVPGYFALGLDSNQSGSPTYGGVQLSGPVVQEQSTGMTMGTFSYGVDTEYAVVTPSTTVLLLLQRKVGESWKLLYRWAGVGSMAAGVYPQLAENSGGLTVVDNFRVALLPAPWNSDWGIAHTRVAIPAVNEVIGMHSDFWLEFTWAAVTGQTWNLWVRRIDDSNGWIVRANQAGSTIKLIEIVAGVETERSSAAQTWTNGTSYRVVVIGDGFDLKVFVANGIKMAYAVAAYYGNTAKSDRAGVDFASFPRCVSLPAGV